MFCRKCGKQISEAARFCRYCGTTVSTTERQLQKQPLDHVDIMNKRTSQTDRKDDTSTKDTNFENLCKWLTKACGIVVILGLFMPLIDYEYFTASGYEIFIQILTEGEESLFEIITLFILILFGFGIALLLMEEGVSSGSAAVGGAVTLLILRIVPNYLINRGIEDGIGFSLGVEVIRFGAGWWIMLLAFLTAIAIGLVVPNIRGKH